MTWWQRFKAWNESTGYGFMLQHPVMGPQLIASLITRTAIASYQDKKADMIHPELVQTCDHGKVIMNCDICFDAITRIQRSQLTSLVIPFVHQSTTSVTVYDQGQDFACFDGATGKIIASTPTDFRSYFYGAQGGSRD